MSKRKNIRKSFTVPIYGAQITLIQTNNFGKVEKEFNLQDTDGMDAFVFTSDQLEYVICLDHNINLSVVAHECLHVVNRILDDIHSKLDATNDEPQAYLLTFVMKKVLSYLGTYKIK